MKRYLVPAFAMILMLVSAPGRAKPRYGGVTLTADVPGATVSLGRRSWPLPKTLWLRRGATYDLKVAAAGRLDKVERVTITRARQAVRIKLASITATLSTTSADESAVGAVLRVNGEPVGRVPTTVDVKPGRVLLEARREGYAPWSRWVELAPGKKEAVAVQMNKVVGSLSVDATPATAKVQVDGEDRGAVPVVLKEVAAGSRLVEVTADGYAPVARTVRVRAGETSQLKVKLEPLEAAAAGGTLQVLTDPEGVDVYLDGEFRGKAPMKLADVTRGTHILSVRWPGHRTVDREVKIDAGRLTAVKVKLTKESSATTPGGGVAEGGNMLVASTVRGAAVFLDNALIGQTPHAQAGLTPGTYRVKVLAPGHRPVVETVQIFANRTVRVMASLLPEAAIDTADRAAASGAGAGLPAPALATSPALSVRGLSSFGADLVPPRHFTANMGLGFPYLFEGRLLTGVFSRGHLGLDTGVEFRTNGSFNEGGLVGRVRFLRRSPFSSAGFVQLGGGAGPGSRNTFYANLGLAGSMQFRDMLTFTATLYGNLYTDRLCSETPESGELDACIFPPGGLSYTEVRDRVGGARFLMSAALDLAVTDHVGAFVLIEGAPFQDQRLAFTDRFVGLMPGTDPRFYGRAGLTFKF